MNSLVTLTPRDRSDVIQFRRSRVPKPASCFQRARNAKGAPEGAFANGLEGGSGRFGLHHHLDRRFGVGVQVDGDLELAGIAQRAFAQHHFRLVDRRAGLGQGFGDVARA